MASLGGNMLPPDISPKLLFAGIAGVVFFAVGLSQLTTKSAKQQQNKNNKTSSVDDSDSTAPGVVKSLVLFCYGCFFKPHEAADSGNQQDALESFYASQAGVYDRTRKTLLKGREDMLALVAAQLSYKSQRAAESGNGKEKKKYIWVDVREPQPRPCPSYASFSPLDCCKGHFANHAPSVTDNRSVLAL
jgi:betaine lipid synthase